MSSRTIEISAEQAVLLDQIVETGLYATAAAALGDALRALHDRIVERDMALRDEIARGVTGLEGGALTEGEEEDLDKFLDGWAHMAGTNTPGA